MNNQRSPFGMKLVSALLAVLMLFSANAAAMLPVFAAEINVAPSAAIQKNVYVVDDSADPMFCYWWNGSDNGFADVDTAAIICLVALYAAAFDGTLATIADVDTAAFF